MATIKLSLVDEKIDELKKAIATMQARNTEDPTNPTYVAKSTQRTQVYHMTREKRVLKLIRALIAANPEVTLKPDESETFALITTLASERTTTKYVFAEGDSIYELMTKYENLSRKDLDTKLEKLGLKADFASGKIVKA